ncbi:putative GNAT family acetyltransferase [Aspergillus filifer]
MATLALTEASPADAPRIADIHMAAFGNNHMLLAQFPTPEVRAGLWTALKEKALSEMQDPYWTVLVVRDEGSGEIISFAKWQHPIPEVKQNVYEEKPWEWPAGTRLDILDQWTRKIVAAGERLLGTMPCYSLSFIGTDPEYERRGAASMLVNWGLERARKENVPAALESTKNAWAFYEKLGFKGEETISMALDGVGEAGESVLYEEVCFVFRP